MEPQNLELKFPLAHLKLNGDILRIIMQPDQTITLNAVKELYREANIALKEKPVAVLLDTRLTYLMHYPETVMRYAANNEHSHKEIAYAILIEGLGHRMLAKFYMQMHRPKTPTRIFGDEKEALEWLQAKVNERKG